MELLRLSFSHKDKDIVLSMLDNIMLINNFYKNLRYPKDINIDI